MPGSWLDQYLWSSAAEIAASLVVAVLAFLAGYFRREIAIYLRARRLRRYWNPLRRRGLRIVIGSDLVPPGGLAPAAGAAARIDLENVEQYGLLGLGDVLALMEIQECLRLLGFDRADISHSAATPLDARDRHLVLIGGPDCNRLTGYVMAAARIPVEFVTLEDHRIGIRNSGDGTVLSSELDANGGLRKDVGFVAHVPNPFSENSWVVILAGAFGAATLGAARLVSSAAGASRLRPPGGTATIAFFEVQVHGGQITVPTVLSVNDF